ncbi:hypothetical protein N0V83_002955 [Neocucurbitaria cava]|uniref:Protein kinase domain-containing protein n=1 Tax=Neocucurbitaria cava TaxID=798079 RepID=A0A9W8YD32_9PLEO|nr:hypothetical protein N0V83_002955 [Neocucurbitaria cava]
MNVNTPFDLLRRMKSVDINYAGLMRTIKENKMNWASTESAITAERMIAWCMCQLAEPEVAFASLQAILAEALSRTVELTERDIFAVMLDQLKYMHALEEKDNALRISKHIFRKCGEVPALFPRQAIDFICQKLTTAGLTHFTHEILTANPTLIYEENLHTVGTGSYARVDSIKIDQQDMVWRWMLCLANTLAFIHAKDIRHKDIKPRNILVHEVMHSLTKLVA